MLSSTRAGDPDRLTVQLPSAGLEATERLLTQYAAEWASPPTRSPVGAPAQRVVHRATGTTAHRCSPRTMSASCTSSSRSRTTCARTTSSSRRCCPGSATSRDPRSKTRRTAAGNGTRLALAAAGASSELLIVDQQPAWESNIRSQGQLPPIGPNGPHHLLVDQALDQTRPRAPPDGPGGAGATWGAMVPALLANRLTRPCGRWLPRPGSRRLAGCLCRPAPGWHCFPPPRIPARAASKLTALRRGRGRRRLPWPSGNCRLDEETPQGAHLHPKVTSVLLVGQGRPMCSRAAARTRFAAGLSSPK
jgi:hypothetical protein